MACLHPSVLSFVNGLILFWAALVDRASTCYLCLCKRSWNEWSQSERCICKIVRLAVEWCEVQNPRSRYWLCGTIKSWSKQGYRANIFLSLGHSIQTRADGIRIRMKPGTLQGCMKTCILIILFPVRCFGCGDYGSWWLKIYRLLPVYFWFGVVACLHPSVLSFVNGLILFWAALVDRASTCYLCLCKRSWNEWSQSERCICKIVRLAVEWCEVQNPRSRYWLCGTIKSWSKQGYRANIFLSLGHSIQTRADGIRIRMKPGTLQGCMKTCILIILFPVRCFGCGDYGSWWLKIFRLLPHSVHIQYLGP